MITRPRSPTTRPWSAAGFRALLDAEPDIEVVGEAGRRRRGACASRASTAPDVVLMDIRMPGARRARGDPAIDRGRPALASVRVVILTTFELDEYVFEALRAGASGFLVKDTEPADLMRGGARGRRRRRAAVAERDPPADRGVRRPAPSEPRPAAGARPRSPTASARCWRSSADGLSNDEIAERLVVSPATAKTHVSRAMIKLGARDRAQLVVFAYESGLVRPGWLD